MLNLPDLVGKYHKSAGSYCELVPYFSLLTNGLVINLNGSLLAGFVYDGLDRDSTDEDEMDTASQSLEIGFGALDNRNQIWTYTDKRRRVFYEGSDIAHPVARFVEDHWLNHTDDGNLACFKHVIFVAFQPFGGTDGVIESVGAIMHETGAGLGQAVVKALKERLLLKAGIERVEGKVTGAVQAFESQLEAFAQPMARLNLRRLQGQNLLVELSNRVNLASPRSKVSIPPTGPVYLNTLLTTDSVERRDGGVLRFTGGDRYREVQMLSIKGYPGELRNADAEDLLMIHGDFTVVQHFRPLHRESAHSHVQREEAHYRSMVKGPITQMVEKITGEESERIDSGQLALADDAQEALVEITRDNVNFGYHTFAIQVLGDDAQDLARTRKAISGALSNAGFGVVNEVMHQVGAFMATIPGASDVSLRATMISTRNLADLALVRSIQPGPNQNRYLSEQRRTASRPLCLFPTPSGVPELMNLHVGDVGHFAVLGPSGAGKTTFMNLLFAMWQRYQPCRVIVLDKDRSCYLTIKALGGSYVQISDADGNTSAMNPLRWMDQPARWGDIVRWIMGAMDAFGGAPITAQEAQAINNAISLSASAGAHGARTLGAFKSVLEGIDHEFAARLSPWVRSGGHGAANYGHLFDNEIDSFGQQLRLGSSGVIGIDMGGLLRDERLAPSVLEYLFMCIDEMVDGRVPTLIYLEEAWYLLSNERFRAGFEDWLKTMRKRMAAVGLSTQSVEDIRRSKISSTLNDNIKTRIFLPNPQALASRDVYKEFLGLTDSDVELIRALTPKRHYLLWQDGRKRVLDGHMSPEVLALTRSDALARDTFDRIYDPKDESSVLRYIKEITRA